MKAECKRNQAAINYYVRLYGSDRAVPFPGSYGLEMTWVAVRAVLFKEIIRMRLSARIHPKNDMRGLEQCNYVVLKP